MLIRVFVWFGLAPLSAVISIWIIINLVIPFFSWIIFGLFSFALSSMIIDRDAGKRVYEYVERNDAETGKVSVLVGSTSSCPMWVAFGDRNCNYREAKWRIHGAIGADPMMPMIIDPYANQTLAVSFSPAVRQKFEREWANMKGQSKRVTSGTKMMEMGV